MGKNKKNKTNSSIIAAAWLLTILVQLVLIICPAKALIYWQNSGGTANGFDWSNGGSDKGFFGEPTLVGGNVLQFSPTNFRAESIDGHSAIKSDRLQFDIITHPGIEIQGIRITEGGDYGILSEGKVSAGGAMFLTNMSQYEVRNTTFQMDPVMPISPPLSDGLWSGEAAIEGLDWTHIRVVLNNNLIAVSRPGSITWIEKKSFGVGSSLGIEIIIPEPATVALLGLGVLSLIRRKNNNKQNQ